MRVMYTIELPSNSSVPKLRNETRYINCNIEELIFDGVFLKIGNAARVLYWPINKWAINQNEVS